MDGEYLSQKWGTDIEVIRRTKSGAKADDIYNNKIVAERSYMQSSNTKVVTFEMCGNDYLQARSAFASQTGTCDLSGLNTALSNCTYYMGAAMDYINANKGANVVAKNISNIFYPGYDADNVLTGCTIKMYGMRESSQNPYNIAMAAVCMSDIQVCSGNGAWGDVADTAETWRRVRPLWDLLESIDFDKLIEARPWYAQELVSGEGFYAGNYTMPDRVIVFLASKSETPGPFEVQIKVDHLPRISGQWHVRYALDRKGALGPLGDGKLKLVLPGLHQGPIALELTAR